MRDVRGLIVADLRHSLRIWVGSLLLLTVVYLCSMWVCGLLMIGVTNISIPAIIDAVSGMGDGAPSQEFIDAMVPVGIVSSLSVCLVVFAGIAAITVRNIVNAIVYQRRRTLALWQLAGMTDAQMLKVLRGQVGLLSVAAVVIAAVVAIATAPAMIEFLRSGGLMTAEMGGAGIYIGYVLGVVVAAVVSVIAVNGASRELRAISPLEAIRSEGVRELPMTRSRWSVAGILLALAVVIAGAALATKKVDDASGPAILAGFAAVAACATAGPVVIVGLMRAWTGLVPAHLSASWFLARETLAAATARTVATISSVAITVFLFTGMFSLLMTAQPGTGGIGGQDVFGFTLIVGFPTLVAATGAVVIVFMAGQQREHEIQLAELAGATPAQQLRQALFEAVIVVVTGVIIGGVLALVPGLLIQPALLATYGSAGYAFAWLPFLIAVGSLLVLNVLATVTPTLIAQGARDRIVLTA
ncbi:FtsX-like permease family protein [Microbacterium sp. NPDC057650]|uniref:FtsX-like permease family protein n=1 Tax=unclassified Microbacterium TaxID=2609290 RepID=UPI00366E64DC